MRIKPYFPFVLVALIGVLAACAQPGVQSAQQEANSGSARISQQDLDLKDYQMLRSSVLSQSSAIQRAHDVAWYAVHDDGGIRNHAGCYQVSAVLMSSPFYDQFSQLMIMVYRGRCVTEVTAVLKTNEPKAGKK